MLRNLTRVRFLPFGYLRRPSEPTAGYRDLRFLEGL